MTYFWQSSAQFRSSAISQEKMSNYQQQFQLQISCSWHHELKTDSLGSSHDVILVLGSIFSSDMFSLYFQSWFLRSQPKKTSAWWVFKLLSNVILTFKEVERREKEKKYVVILWFLENYPKWQTAVKFSLRESQCEPDELCISIEHEVEWGAPHQPWFFLFETNEFRWHQWMLLLRIFFPALSSSLFCNWLAILSKQIYKMWEQAWCQSRSA